MTHMHVDALCLEVELCHVRSWLVAKETAGNTRHFMDHDFLNVLLYEGQQVNLTVCQGELE